MSELIKPIEEYFNTFSNKDYTIHVDGTPTEWCCLNDYSNYIVWRTILDNIELDWYYVSIHGIEAIKLTPTTMEIIKTDGKAYKFVAKPKTKEEKAKDIILRAKIALQALHYNDVLTCLIKLKALMDE